VALSWCSDLSPAAWLVASDLPWDRLVTFGPGGFESYARLRFLPDPTRPGQSENDADIGQNHPSDNDQLRRLGRQLVAHTTTPDELYFCLWEGWGLDGGTVRTWPDGRSDVEEPHFPDEVLAAPRLHLPHRAYLLFRGGLSDFGDWGASPRWPEIPSPSWEPAFVWPADQAWCVANDVDPHWAGIGCSAEALRQLMNDRDLDVVDADPGEPQPWYR
jgi:hypothetical protein